MAAICILSPAESQSATPVTGWEGDKGGLEGEGGGIYGQRGQQMPAEATGDLPESILLLHPPRIALLQLVVSRFILSATYHHCLSCDLFGRGLWLALTFTSELCRLSVGYVWFCLSVSN